jgi:hypothetical protein
VDKYKLEVWDDSQGWRDGAWRWKILDEDGQRVGIADRDYLSRHEAELAGRDAKRNIEGYEKPERVDYRQFSRPKTTQGPSSTE